MLCAAVQHRRGHPWQVAAHERRGDRSQLSAAMEADMEERTAALRNAAREQATLGAAFLPPGPASAARLQAEINVPHRLGQL